MENSYLSLRSSAFFLRNVSTSCCNWSACCSRSADNCCVNSETATQKNKSSFISLPNWRENETLDLFVGPQGSRRRKQKSVHFRRLWQKASEKWRAKHGVWQNNLTNKTTKTNLGTSAGLNTWPAGTPGAYRSHLQRAVIGSVATFRPNVLVLQLSANDRRQGRLPPRATLRLNSTPADPATSVAHLHTFKVNASVGRRRMKLHPFFGW